MRSTFNTVALAACIIGCAGVENCVAEGPPQMEFPWGCDAHPTAMRAEYRTLPSKNPASARPIAEMPAKVPYAYGWFGPNPQWQWKRQFGHSKSFTQWSQR